MHTEKKIQLILQLSSTFNADFSNCSSVINKFLRPLVSWKNGKFFNNDKSTVYNVFAFFATWKGNTLYGTSEHTVNKTELDIATSFSPDLCEMSLTSWH